MNLYLLERPKEDVGYDESFGMIIVADSSEEAIELAEGHWGDADNYPELESNVMIGSAVEGSEKGVVLVSFNAG